MKVLQFAPHFPPFPGGQEQYVLNLSVALARKGHDVEVVTTSPSSTITAPLPDGVRVKSFRPLVTLLRNPIAPKIAVSLRHFRGSDVIHCHNEHAFTSLMAAALRGMSRTPMVLTVHGQLVFGGAVLDCIERAYEACIGRMILSRADRIAVLSNSDMSFVSKLSDAFRDKTFLTANAIDKVRIDELGLQSIEERINNNVISGVFNDNERILLFVGQMVKRKGISTLLEGYAELPNRIKNRLTLVLVGEGPDKNEFIRLANNIDKKKIIFLGYLTEQNLDQVYRRADIFCLPSYSEGFPGAVLEAMYYGLPAILTSIPGMLDRFGDTAIFVEPNNAHQIAGAIESLMNDEELRAKMSHKGRDFVTRNYTWDRIADDYIKVYQDLLDAHGG